MSKNNPSQSDARVEETEAQQTMNYIETGNYNAVGLPPEMTGLF